jgi:hypothetical protein
MRVGSERCQFFFEKILQKNSLTFESDANCEQAMPVLPDFASLFSATFALNFDSEISNLKFEI